MEAYQQRVVDEKQALDKKLVKLMVFFSNPIFGRLAEIDRDLLRRQADIMAEYSFVLHARIGRFGM